MGGLSGLLSGLWTSLTGGLSGLTNGLTGTAATAATNVAPLEAGSYTNSGLDMAGQNLTGQSTFMTNPALKGITTQPKLYNPQVNSQFSSQNYYGNKAGGLGGSNLIDLLSLGYGAFNDYQNRKRTDFALENTAKINQNKRARSKHLGKSTYGSSYTQPGEDLDTTV